MNGSHSTARPTAEWPLRRGAAVAALAVGVCLMGAGCAQRLVQLRATPYNPLGAKGLGEAGTIGLPPAVVNAVVDALAPLGVRHLDMPLAPAKIWARIAAS